MVDRLAMAKQIVREHVAARGDIVGVLLLGSVARGEDTETSDIDLSFYVRAATGEGPRDLDGWRTGVYVEAGAVTMDGMRSLDEVMANAINATHMNDAVILYDPTEHFTRLQAEVRRVYMEPRWLRARIAWITTLYRRYLAELRAAAIATDALAICRNARAIPHGAAAVPLYIAGVTPSSTRKLLLLSQVSPEMREKIVELECALPLTSEAVEKLHGICSRWCAVMDRREHADLGDYGAWKARHSIERGSLDEAVDILWFVIGMGGPAEGKEQEARGIAEAWLAGVGWSEAAALEGKLRLAEDLLRRIETLGEEATRPV